MKDKAFGIIVIKIWLTYITCLKLLNAFDRRDRFDLRMQSTFLYFSTISNIIILLSL
jgi:hypothetical protein